MDNSSNKNKAKPLTSYWQGPSASEEAENVTIAKKEFGKRFLIAARLSGESESKVARFKQLAGSLKHVATEQLTLAGLSKPEADAAVNVMMIEGIRNAISEAGGLTIPKSSVAGGDDVANLQLENIGSKSFDTALKFIFDHFPLNKKQASRID